MRRRDFMRRVPVVLPIAAAGVTGSATAAVAADRHARREMSDAGAAPGFRIVGGGEEVREAMVLGEPRRFTLHEFVVECPYPVRSRTWLSIADRDETGQVVLCDETGPVPLVEEHRRVVFPRFQEEDLVEGIEARVEGVLAASAVHGFDDVDGDQADWMAVHVEFRCPDGVEHVVAGLPAEWDPRLVLGVMVKGQIGVSR